MYLLVARLSDGQVVPAIRSIFQHHHSDQEASTFSSRERATQFLGIVLSLDPSLEVAIVPAAEGSA
jgi:hypothetical protein